MTLQEERDHYHYNYYKFSRMSTEKLQEKLQELGRRRYEEYDNTCCTEHRIAARVYLEKTRKGESLVFHLQNFLG
jgi:hypothetical protein